MTIAILSLGTELLRGELLNTNAQWLAETLSEAGQEVSEIACIGDDRQQIVATLARLTTCNDSIVCTGGLGPTTDDLTTEAVAELVGEPLVVDTKSLSRIRARYTRMGREMEPSNEKQARFPKSADVLDNANGTAPGFAVQVQRARAYFLPGVPSEMRAMFSEHVRPELQRNQKDYVHQIRLNTFGLREAAVNDKLLGVEEEFNVQLGYRAHFPDIQVKVWCRARTLAEAERAAQDAALEVRRRLGDEVVYSVGKQPLARVVGERLEQQSRVLGLAESCTGGLIAELLTENPGASAYFAGSVVCYANEVKERVLGVPPELLRTHGAVSQPVAEAMARGACCTLNVTLALAVTGVAGPTGGSIEKPVGLVHLALLDGDRLIHKEHLFSGTRWQIQRRAAYTGLSMLRNALSGPAS